MGKPLHRIIEGFYKAMVVEKNVLGVDGKVSADVFPFQCYIMKVLFLFFENFILEITYLSNYLNIVFFLV